MKRNNKIKIGLLGLAILFSTLINAQFQITPATFNEFMRTAPIIRGVGIGTFPSGVTTNSALHVNTNFMTASTNYPGINFGEVFRTDGPAGVTHAWRMLSNNGTAGEKFNILNPSGTDNINMGTVPLGDFNFFTNNTQRMTIIGVAGANQGYVGINTTTPTYTLTVNGTIAASKIIITIENKEQDLLAVIAQLQREVAELREKMTLQRN